MAPSRFRREKGQIPLLYAHRGASALAPENTMAAFSQALTDGADGVELDVRLTKDGDVVVMHDPDLKRVAHADVEVRHATLAEVQAHDLGRGERAPLLRDVIELVTGRDRLLNIELKTDDVDLLLLAQKVGRLIGQEKKSTQEKLIFSTFHPRMVLYAGSFCPQVPCAFLFENDLRGRALGFLASHANLVSLLHPNSVWLTREHMLVAAKNDAIVNVWTIDDVDEAKRVADLGADGIITNNPAALRSGFRR